MTKPSKIVLAIVGFIVIALVGGYFGAGFRGSTGSRSGGGDSQGAFLDSIKKSGQLRMGVAVAPPMTVKDASGKLGGPNLIPLEDLAKQMNVKLVPVAADWSNIVAGLQAGRYDFAANLDYTVERSLAIQFSNPVYEYQGVFVVKASSPYTTSKEVISAGTIATAQGAALEAPLKGAGGKLLSVSTYANAISALKAGRVVGEFTDLPTAESQTQADSSLKIIVPSPSLYSASSAYGVPASIDSRSLQTVNIAIERAQKSNALSQAYAKVNYREVDDLGDLAKK